MTVAYIDGSLSSEYGSKDKDAASACWLRSRFVSCDSTLGCLTPSDSPLRKYDRRRRSPLRTPALTAMRHHHGEGNGKQNQPRGLFVSYPTAANRFRIRLVRREILAIGTGLACVPNAPAEPAAEMMPW